MAQTNYPSHASAATVILKTIIASEVILDLNSFRDSFIINNIGDVPVYIKYGPNCDTVLYTVRLKPNAFFGDSYDGLLSACTSSGTGFIVITEKL